MFVPGLFFFSCGRETRKKLSRRTTRKNSLKFSLQHYTSPFPEIDPGKTGTENLVVRMAEQSVTGVLQKDEIHQPGSLLGLHPHLRASGFPAIVHRSVHPDLHPGWDRRRCRATGPCRWVRWTARPRMCRICWRRSRAACAGCGPWWRARSPGAWYPGIPATTASCTWKQTQMLICSMISVMMVQKCTFQVDTVFWGKQQDTVF